MQCAVVVICISRPILAVTVPIIPVANAIQVLTLKRLIQLVSLKEPIIYI